MTECMKPFAEMILSCEVFFLFLVIFSQIFQQIYGATDTINSTESIRDGESLVSPGGILELGFFSPGNSTNRYLGLWYKNLTVRTIVWVANREDPLTNTNGVLKVIKPGLLVLINDLNATIWSSNATRSVQNPILQLLDTGNIVLRDANDDRPENFLWQSFDYPTDTILAGMKFGWDLKTGRETYLSSWKSNDDPSPGEYSFRLDPTGYPQMLLKKGPLVQSRIGPWNGNRFSGTPNPKEDALYRLEFTMDDEKVTYIDGTADGSHVTRFTLGQSGFAQCWTWIDHEQGWTVYMKMPVDICDTYRMCGAYGSCKILNSPSCGCLDRFVPKDPEGWSRADWSKGCVRRSNLSCQSDVFLKYTGIKMPDATHTWYSTSMTLEECKAECLKNCSCMAYTELDVNKRNGCLIWYGELLDIRTLSTDGQDIYIRMASSESGSKGKKGVILIASLASVMGVILVGLSLFLYVRKRGNGLNIYLEEKCNGSHGKDSDSELLFFDLSVISKATNLFSSNNMLGEGGFGPVYKGVLEDGKEIAVKRLSKSSMQGFDEFKNEAIFIAKLQHRNLVRLLGCCSQREEKMLIYEYMHNKSLDMILFDQTKRMLLSWETRFNIINGIARGLLYLHQDSRLRIIHRDLKPSNILLDSDMNPKISDFGMARSFKGDETAAKTRRIVGTYGYMSPEYAIDGLFSIKSDVFSFGVLVLEIVSGRRNRGFFHDDSNLNLLGHAWVLHKEGKSLDLVDTCLVDSCQFSEVVRSIHVGLLCIQRNPEDRPSMSSVVLMLLGNEAELPEAKMPGFFTEREGVAAPSSSVTKPATSSNVITITMPEAR